MKIGAKGKGRWLKIGSGGEVQERRYIYSDIDHHSFRSRFLESNIIMAVMNFALISDSWQCNFGIAVKPTVVSIVELKIGFCYVSSWTS